jgi:hypothetical protein
MKYITLSLSLLVFGSSVSAQISDAEPSADYYLFMSGKVSAQIKRDFFPIESFDGKRLQLTGSKKSLKPVDGLNCSMQPVMVISKYFVEIRDLEFSFDSQAEKLRTMMAINEMNAEQMRQQATNEFEKAVAAMNGDRQLVSEGDRSVEALGELTKDRTEKELLYSGLHKQVDSLYGRCTIVPDTDLKNAYTVAVLSFEGVGATNKSAGQQATFVRIAPVGDLKTGVGEPIKFDYSFPELKASSAKIDLFLFNGDSKHVATNLSRGLKPLTTEEFEEFRNIEKKAKTKNAG